ncbi:MAG: hypothetical protein ACI94Y_000354 [Maribacter sp.]|jgi:hypothetical protein
MGSMQGLDTKSATAWTNNPIWNGNNNPDINYNNAVSNAIYPNYKVNYMEANLMGKFTFSQLGFFKSSSPFDGFLLGGIV